MKIRQEHKDAFSTTTQQGFENRMVEHLRKFFPARCSRLGEPNTHELVRQGIERASSYGIVNERDVCRYIDLMLDLGAGFDDDRNLPWASEILRREKVDPSCKVDLLCEMAERRKSASGSIGAQAAPIRRTKV